MIPSFSIMGINSDFEDMARKVQEYACLKDKVWEARTRQQINASLPNRQQMYALVLQLENVCNQACKELGEEWKTQSSINNKTR